MIFSPSKSTPAPSPSPAPAPSPSPSPSPSPAPAPSPSPSPAPAPSPSPAPPFVTSSFPFLPRQENPRFAFYVVDGQNQNPQVVCLKVSDNINCLAGPFDNFDDAKQKQEYLKNIPPTP